MKSETQTTELTKPGNKNKTNMTKLPDAQKPFKSEDEFDVNKMKYSAGSVVLTADERKILYEPFTFSELNIRPDGIVFASWSAYSKRVANSIAAEWAMISETRGPMYDEDKDGKYVVISWPHHLIIRNKYATYAIGDQKYYYSNSNMTKADAVKGAWSDCFKRLWSQMGVGTNVYDRTFTDEFKNKYCEQWVNPRVNPKKNKKEWRRKDGTKKYFYFKIINYLFELLDLSEEKYLKSKGLVSLTLCEDDRLSEIKTELEATIKSKMTSRSVKDIMKNSKKKGNLIIDINKMISKKFDTKAQRITFLKKYNISDINKSSEKELVTIRTDLKKQAGPVKKDEPKKKNGKTLKQYMVEAENIAKKNNIKMDDFNKMYKESCGDQPNITKAKIFIKKLNDINKGGKKK